jgi:hypothetical protein
MANNRSITVTTLACQAFSVITCLIPAPATATVAAQTRTVADQGYALTLKVLMKKGHANVRFAASVAAARTMELSATL